jgi:hypothetical protein
MIHVREIFSYRSNDEHIAELFEEAGYIASRHFEQREKSPSENIINQMTDSIDPLTSAFLRTQ